jgi:carbohydrate-selective porin OprB
VIVNNLHAPALASLRLIPIELLPAAIFPNTHNSDRERVTEQSREATAGAWRQTRVNGRCYRDAHRVHAWATSVAAQQAFSRAGSTATGAEMALEFTYQAQFTKWLAVQPDIQFIINPGGTQDLNNALVIGARAVMTF